VVPDPSNTRAGRQSILQTPSNLNDLHLTFVPRCLYNQVTLRGDTRDDLRLGLASRVGSWVKTVSNLHEITVKKKNKTPPYGHGIRKQT